MRLGSRSPRFLLPLAVLVLACGSGWAQSDNQSLGDVAKKNQAEEAAAKKARKVYTDEDMPSTSGAGSNAAAPSSVASSAATAPATGDAKPAPDADKDKAKAASPEADDPGKAEARRLAKERADNYSKDAEAMQRKYKNLQDQYDKETDPFRRMVMEQELSSAPEKVAAMQKKADDAAKEASGGGSASDQQQGQQQSSAPSPDQTPQ